MKAFSQTSRGRRARGELPHIPLPGHHTPQRDFFVTLVDFDLDFTFANEVLVRDVVFVALSVVASGSFV